MRSRLVTAALCGMLVTSSAIAGQIFDPSLVPALRLDLAFGGPAPRPVPFEVALQLQDRAIWRRQVIESNGQVEKIDFSPLSLDLLKVTANRSGLQGAYVFSHDVLQDHSALDEDGASTGGVPQWIWWTVGGVAAAAATALAVGGGNDITINGNSGGDDGGGGGSTGCNVVSGNSVVPPDFYLLQGCPGAPDVHVPPGG